MLTKDKINQFYKDVDRLNLKFPVAAISEETGENKGNVSRILKKKMEPSGAFLTKFYDSFNNVLNEGKADSPSLAKTEDQVDTNVLLTGAQVTLQEHIDLLKQRAKELQADKERLYSLLESNLGGLSNGQQIIYAYVRSLLQIDVARTSQGNKKREVELLDSLEALIEDNRKVDLKSDKALSLRK